MSPVTGGGHEVAWDGDNDGGSPVASGARFKEGVAFFMSRRCLCCSPVPITPLVSEQVVESVLGPAIGLAFIVSIVAGVIFLVKWFRANPAQRTEYGLTTIVVALVFSSVLDLLADGGVLPAAPEAWMLAYALVPMAFTRVAPAHADRGRSGNPGSSH